MVSVKRGLAILGVLLLAALPVAAQEDSGSALPDAVEFNITLTDYSFVVEGMEANQPLELQAGQPYVFHFTNASGSHMAHEVLVGQNAMTLEGGFKHDYETPMLDDVEAVLTIQMGDYEYLVGAAGLNEFEVPPDGEINLSITLPETKVGEWEIGCFEFLSMDNTEEDPGPTHYDVGMHLPIIVTAAVS